ncbi:hypothetical protein FQZ46_19710 [Escherichia coli]|nr:hypothetical protein [Escherichia coli]
MNINAGHEITSKARIIHQIQLIRGITSKVILAIKCILCCIHSSYRNRKKRKRHSGQNYC